MSFLSTELSMASGTDIYHSSPSLDELVESGNFDPTRSSHQGAFFFTPEQVLRTNCMATLQDDLLLFDFTNLPQDEFNQLAEAGEGDFWEGAASLGYDGRLFRNPDPYVEVSKKVYCPELLIFRNSLHKIANIRPLIR
jgi:hypothetical protein